MDGRFHDGLTTATHAVAVEVEGDALRFEAAGEPHVWSAAQVSTERAGETVRLTCRGQPGRLIVATGDWRALGWERTIRRGAMRREVLLLAGLAGFAAAAALTVFVGVPLASGPLARATPLAFEAGIGENYEAQLQLGLPSCTGAAGQAALQRFGARLGQAANSPFPIRVEAVEAPMVNAFALPGGRILVTDDLIDMASGPDELSAVLAHEVAHVERRHVMQAVWRALGFGLILDAVVGGGTGAGQQAVLLAGSVADLRYSRDAEREADAAGQDVLHGLGLSSQGMASFFQRIAGEERGSEESAMVRELVSTHPDSNRRAALSRDRARPGAAAFNKADWAAIKTVCARDPKRRLIPKLN